MDVSILEKYIERIYGYALNNTYTTDEAQDLSQEILLTAVIELPYLRDESRFEPWLFGIARNVTKVFRRKKAKEKALYSYDVLDEFPDEDNIDYEKIELYNRLRKHIAMLSSIYRETIILHYYDNLSVKQISKKLNVPEGTISWRLKVARSKIKEEFENMEESALKPIKMKINIYGSGNFDGENIPFPDAYISDALSQNILFNCYEEPKTVEELAKICGVPAYYIEDSVNNLLKREALVEEKKGKYRTDFIIWFDKYDKFYDENFLSYVNPIKDRIYNAFKNIWNEAKNLNIYKGTMEEENLFHLYTMLSIRYVNNKYNKMPWRPLKIKYNGFEWNYIASYTTGKYSNHMYGFVRTGNASYGGNTIMERITGIDGTNKRESIKDIAVSACVDIVNGVEPINKEIVADLIMKGFVIKDRDGKLVLTIPYISKENENKLYEIVEKYLSPLMDEYLEIVKKFACEYIKLFPKHLEDEAVRWTRNVFLGLFNKIHNYGQSNNLIDKVVDNSYLEVMLDQK